MLVSPADMRNNQDGRNVFWLMLAYAIIGVAFPILFRETILFLLYSLFAAYLSFKYSKQNNIFTVYFFKRYLYLFLFIFICVLYLVPSALTDGWSNYYFYDSSFILRHAYFVVFLPLYIAFGMTIYFKLSTPINRYLIKRSIACLVLILSVDTITAILFGNAQFKEWNGYAYFLEKSIIWFFVCYIFFFGIVNSRSKHSLIITITIFFIAQRSLGFGHMFNATTGLVIYLYMLLFYFFFSICKSRSALVSIFSISMLFVFLFIFIAPFYSDLFINDENTYWRLEIWKNNLEAVYDNYGFGVGFGTSYFPDEYEIIDEVYRYWIREGQNGNLIDHLFVRGQHSSLINIMFRTGIFGFICFFIFISSIFKQSYIKRHDDDVLFLFGVFVCGFSNVSVHVGLESPLFLITIGFSLGALLNRLSSQKVNSLSVLNH